MGDDVKPRRLFIDLGYLTLLHSSAATLTRGRTFPFIIFCTASAVSFSTTSLPAQVTTRARTSDVLCNGAIGAITGVLTAAFRHRPIEREIARGLVGGGLISVGRQIAGAHTPGLGFIGREVSGIGVSLIASAGEPETTLSFPFGPLTIESRAGQWNWRLNVASFVATVGLSLSPNTRLDVGRSFESGTPVFQDRRIGFGVSGPIQETGYELLGTIRLARDAFDPRTGATPVIYHENVHVLQDDYWNQSIALPTERWVLRHLHLGATFKNHFDLGLLGPASITLLNRAIPYSSRPWEKEAAAIGGKQTY
jgi:hypothetical protein